MKGKKEREDRIPLLSGSRRHDTLKQKQKSKHSLWGLVPGRAAHLLCRERGYRKCWWCSSFPVLPNVQPASQFSRNCSCARERVRDKTYVLCSRSCLSFYFSSSLLLLNNPRQCTTAVPGRQTAPFVLDVLPGLFGFMIAASVLRFPRSAWHRSCWNWLVPPRLYQQRLMAGDAAAVPAIAAFGGVVGYEHCNGCGRGRD